MAGVVRPGVAHDQFVKAVVVHITRFERPTEQAPVFGLRGFRRMEAVDSPCRGSLPVVNLRRTDPHGVVSSGGGEAITAVGVVKRRNGTAMIVGDAR